ncbi:MAG: hypothetical protein J6Q40_02305 [Tidjanibacter sp.]|nr:hypothetical protein [Tidjanibacter sp.]
MKNTAKLSLVALAFSLILAGCWGDDTDEKALKAKQDFETLTNYGIYANGQYTFKYTDEDYQIAFNESNNSVRLQKDDMTTYAIFSLDSAPSKGAMVQLTVQGKGVSTVKATQMEVVKTSSDGVWIWDKTSLTGYYIYWEF